jgi:hypothetical protein
VDLTNGIYTRAQFKQAINVSNSYERSNIFQYIEGFWPHSPFAALGRASYVPK